MVAALCHGAARHPGRENSSRLVPPPGPGSRERRRRPEALAVLLGGTPGSRWPARPRADAGEDPSSSVLHHQHVGLVRVLHDSRCNFLSRQAKTRPAALEGFRSRADGRGGLATSGCRERGSPRDGHDGCCSATSCLTNRHSPHTRKALVCPREAARGSAGALRVRPSAILAGSSGRELRGPARASALALRSYPGRQRGCRQRRWSWPVGSDRRRVLLFSVS